MGKEIERKFLVNKDLWATIDKPEGSIIKQAYLNEDIECMVRVRIIASTNESNNAQAFLTIKGKNIGITRPEFEYEIPLSDAETMISEMCQKVITKIRYLIPAGSHFYEVDVFENKLEGLIIAELELLNEDEAYEKPEFIGKEVSFDARYYNSNLIQLDSYQSL